MPEHDILVVGSVNMDLVLEVAAPPRPGETVLARKAELLPGGKGANQAVAASRLGSRVRMVGMVGEDAIGVALRQGLAAEGILTDTVDTAPGMSGMAAISLTPDGENAITVAQGANGELAAARILALPDELFACKALLVQLEVPLAAVAAAARRARAQGAIILLNPSPPRQDLEEAVGLSQWLVPNRLEATLLTGIADPAAAGRALLAQGPEVVCVTLGAEGALVVTRGEERQIAAPKVQAVDTTGAGDAFMGALAVAFCEGRDPFGAAEFAVAAGALATRRKGAQAALPTREELEDFRRHR